MSDRSQIRFMKSQKLFKVIRKSLNVFFLATKDVLKGTVQRDFRPQNSTSQNTVLQLNM